MKGLFKNRKVVIGIAALATVAVVVGIVLFVSRSGDKETVRKEKVYQVSVMEAGETGSDVSLVYSGIIQPEVIEQATFASIGTVKEIYVKQGQSVRAGMPLAMLDDTEARRQLDNSGNTLRTAENTLKSAKKQRDNAYEDYLEACTAKSEKETLDNAVKRRDEQQQRVDSLKAELDELGGDSSESEGGTGSVSRPITGVVSTDYWYKQQQLVAAQETLETYNQSVNAAQEAYDKKVEEGAESSEAKAQKERLDTAEDALVNAQSAYDSALNNQMSAQEAVDDCTLLAQNDGYVITVEAAVGGVATPIIPAVVLGSNRMVASFGVSQSDIMDLAGGMAATVTVDGNVCSGRIKDIALMPDETSRTYAVNVTLEGTRDDWRLGELAMVEIHIGERRGIWLPLSVILNDGEDYVYVVVDGRAKRKYITIEEIQNDMVMVTGTDVGDKIICEGMKLIRTGSAVSYDGQ